MNALLSTTSPAGSRTTSSFDVIAQFKLCGNANASIGKIGFDLNSDASMNPEALLKPANYLDAFAVKTKLGVDPVGTYTVSSSDSSHVSLVYTMGGSMEIKSGTCNEIEVFANTAALVNSQAGVDNMLSVTLSKLYTSNGGNIPSNVPVNANTLKF